MKEILLSNGLVALVDDQDFDALAQYSWHYKLSGGYAAANSPSESGPVQVRMHRLILQAPDGMQVDHINGNGLDNQRANLRLASRSTNQANTFLSSQNTSGYKGVYYEPDGHRFRARI